MKSLCKSDQKVYSETCEQRPPGQERQTSKQKPLHKIPSLFDLLVKYTSEQRPSPLLVLNARCSIFIDFTIHAYTYNLYLSWPDLLLLSHSLLWDTERTRCSSHTRGDIWWQVVRTGTSRPQEVPVRTTRHQISPWVRKEHLVLYLLYDIIPFPRRSSSYSTTKNTGNWWDIRPPAFITAIGYRLKCARSICYDIIPFPRWFSSYSTT